MSPTDREKPPPADVFDVRLWRDAQAVMSRHRQDTFPNESRCAFCHDQWVCQPRDWANKADRLARER